MNKSYKCDFCAYDTGPLMATNENCTNCMYGSCFKLKQRMAGCQKDTWLGHRKLDKFLKDNNAHLLPSQHDFMHRIMIRTPVHFIGKPRYQENLSIIRAFKDMICNVKLEHNVESVAIERKETEK